MVSQAQADYSSQQLANVLAFNSLLQHPQNSQLYSSPSTATASLSQQQVHAQQQQQQLYYTLMRLQAVQQMQQQQQFAAMMNGYSLSGLVPGLASGYPAGLIDSRKLRTVAFEDMFILLSSFKVITNNTPIKITK